MAKTKTQKKALAALNYSLFQPEDLAPPAPATIDSKILDITRRQQPPLARESIHVAPAGLPTVDQLYQLFDVNNWTYYRGKLPLVTIEYSSRMTSAGSYLPAQKLIRIGRRYHEIFPDEITDTLKHEMIHVRLLKHDAAFKAEAQRIGASVRARHHPLLRKPPRYVYECRTCGRQYPRQRRLRMASCGYCTSGTDFDPRFKLKLKRRRQA